jgi:hypothetical protein
VEFGSEVAKVDHRLERDIAGAHWDAWFVRIHGIGVLVAAQQRRGDPSHTARLEKRQQAILALQPPSRIATVHLGNGAAPVAAVQAQEPVVIEPQRDRFDRRQVEVEDGAQATCQIGQQRVAGTDAGRLLCERHMPAQYSIYG